MTMSKQGLAIAAAFMLIAGSSFAQSTSPSGPTTPTGQTPTTGSTTPSGTTTTTGSTTTGSFQSLSPGNQKIARALFLAQQPSKTGPAPLSLDQIAALKGSEGWGQVFKQMKTEGLVQDKNLGQVVSSYEHQVHSGTVTSGGHTTGVTTASGRTVTSGSGHSHGDGISAGHAHDADAATVTTASGATAGGHTVGGSSVSMAGGGSHGGGGAHGR